MTRVVPFFRPHFPPEMRRRITAAMDEVLASGTLMMGPWKDRFEQDFARLCGVPHAVSVNTATTALQISLSYYDVQGADVLVPAGSFLTDVSSVMMAGGRPVLVDMNPDTLALDLNDMERKLTPQTKGVIWVHLAGLITREYRDIRAFVDRHGLFLIEDASHAHGAVIDGRPAGSIGDVGVFSFYPTKVTTAGTGGMLTTADTGLKDFAEEMRLFGKEPETGEIVRLGNDWFLDEVRACVGWHQLDGIDTQLARRREIAARYGRALANQPGLRMLDVPVGHTPTWYHYPVFVDDGVDYDRLARTLKEAHGIATKPIYKPTHREKIFRHLDDGSLTVTERTLGRSLCLPMFVDLPDADADYVTEMLIAELRAAG